MSTKHVQALRRTRSPSFSLGNQKTDIIADHLIVSLPVYSIECHGNERRRGDEHIQTGGWNPPRREHTVRRERQLLADCR